MDEYRLTMQQAVDYGVYLRGQEREQSTIEKYLHNVREFCSWMGVQSLSKERVAEWKEIVSRSGHAPATVNGKIAAVNGFLEVHRAGGVQSQAASHPAQSVSRFVP